MNKLKQKKKLCKEQFFSVLYVQDLARGLQQ